MARLLLVFIPCSILFIFILLKSEKAKNIPAGFIMIDGLVRESHLKEVSPYYKSLLFLILIGFSLLTENVYVFIVVLSLSFFLTCVLGKIPLKSYLKLLFLPLSFILLTGIVLILNFSFKKPVDIKFLKIGSLFVYITRDSFLRALGLSLKALSAVSALYFLSLSTPLGELLMVLEKIHCPKLLIELMHLIYRFIFIMIETEREMSTAAKSRLGFKDYPTSLKSFGKIGANLLIVSLKKAGDYMNALEARGYNGSLKFLRKTKRVTKAQVVFLVVLILYLSLVNVLI